MTAEYLLLFIRCKILSVKLQGLDSVFAFLFTAKVSLVIVINCIWSFLSSPTSIIEVSLLASRKR